MKLALEVVVGVPVRAPVLLFNDNQAGRPVAVQVMGVAVLPDWLSVWLYASPVTGADREAGLIVIVIEEGLEG